jgi:hypothetical protein
MTKAEMQAEIDRLKDKCDKQATVIRHVFADRIGYTPFISGEGGEKDANDMPERFHICPAFGCDFSYVYTRGETFGCEW